MTRHYVISDLHLGMGRLANDSWHPLEDFRSDAAFKKFLNFLAENKADELIINGDWLEFMQLEPLAYQNNLFSVDGHRLGWSQDESLQKLESCKAKAAHEGFFSDLSKFLAENKNRKVTVMMGNHDPDLFWPNVQQEMRALLGSPSTAQLEFCQTFVRRGTAHIEHGNQYCSPENKFYNPTNIFHQCAADGKERLEMIWGTIFVMEFFNQIEDKLPFADNLKTQSRAIWLGIRNGWVSGKMAAKFVKFLWGAGIPWSSITANVLSPNEKEPEELIQNLEDRDLATELIDIYDNNPGFKSAFDQEIAATPEEDWKSINSERQQPVTLDQLEPEVVGAAHTLGIFRDEPEFRGAEQLLKQDGVEYVVFGHTHMEIDGHDPKARVKKYFNTGSWIGSIDLAKEENRKRLKTISEDDLKDDKLFDLRLMTALIEVDDNNRTTVELQPLNV
jgi:UDP-2,3-diacylglucosamine pyrophosphatase LpxH